LRESYEFILNGIMIEIDVSEAITLFPGIDEQLLADGCGVKLL
jgi:hypothetical protein